MAIRKETFLDQPPSVETIQKTQQSSPALLSDPHKAKSEQLPKW